MPVQSSLVRFQLSGGEANENPNLSLGSQVSIATNRNIVSNFLHNLFDEVTNTEAVSGEYEYRHFYYRNGATFKVKNAKLMVLADQTSIWSKLEFAKGTANNGNVEQSVPDENTAPVGISDSNWKIPNALNPLLLGDVEAGSTASIWVRRKVEVGALIAKNEKVTIRIIADPPVPVAPPIACPNGQHYDSTTGTCVDDEEEPDDCPTGQHRDANGNCVDNTGTPCPEGQVLQNGQCVPVGSPPPPIPVTIAVAGDLSCNSAAQDVLGHIANIGHAALDAGKGFFFIANGDLSYASSGQCFVDILEDLDIPLLTKISIGNHDDDEEQSTALRTSYINYFGIPSAGYYSFNVQNIHILIMDTQSSYAVNSAQYTFARNDLIAASQAANIDWIIVCYHKPSMTVGSDHAPLTDFRDIYHAMFDTYKVDVVISSHNHNMQRSYPVKHNPSNPSNPTIISTHPSNVYGEDMDARVFIVSGAGGRALDDMSSLPAHYAFGNDSDHGFFVMGWSFNNKRLTGKFWAVNSPTIIEELDMFELNKT